MDSLADFLQIPQDAQDRVDGAKPTKMTIRAMARGILASAEYRQSLIDRIKLGTLPAAIETILYHYAEGKPVERHEIKDTTNPLQNLTAEQVEERALLLMKRAQQLRALAHDKSDPLTTSVH